MATSPEVTHDAATLDPPRSIAVVGAGPLGIEAALYGRFLGYDVTLFEAFGVAHSISDRRDEAIEVMPDRCLSPLAKSALQAQAGDAEPKALPVTIGQWIDQVITYNNQCLQAVEFVTNAGDRSPKFGKQASNRREHNMKGKRITGVRVRSGDIIDGISFGYV